MTKIKLISLGAIALVIGFVLGVIGSRVSNQNSFGAVPGQVIYSPLTVVGDIYQGLGAVKMFTGGNFVGSISSALSAAFSGAVTMTGSFVPNSIGSGYLSLSGNTTTSLTAAQMCGNGVIDFTPTVSNASATLPTAAALQAACLNTQGGRYEVTFRNKGVATTTFLFAAGDASTTLKYGYASSSSAQLLSVPGLNDAKITFYNVTSTQSSTNMVEGLVSIFK